MDVGCLSMKVTPNIAVYQSLRRELSSHVVLPCSARLGCSLVTKETNWRNYWFVAKNHPINLPLGKYWTLL